MSPVTPPTREDDGVGGESSESSLSLSSTLDDDDDDEEEEVQSKPSTDSFGSLDSLEDSLPTKRGLSNFFNGKSKSFASLAEAAALAGSDLAKMENPFNKRRRIVMACKSSWRRRASCVSLSNTCSLPGLQSLEENHREEEDDDGDVVEEKGEKEHHPLSSMRKRLEAFRSPRCFSLSDLQHHAS